MAQIMPKYHLACRRGGAFCKSIVSTARRGGVPFVRTRRRGLRSMSGHPAYAWGNPPTLRRSSFPQRASRPAGGPIPKHAWGCAPRPPNAKLRLDTNDAKASSVRRRRYALKVPAAHFYVEIVDRVPLPAAVEKIEQASSAKIFSGTARRQGLRFAEEAVLQTAKYLLNLPHRSPPLRRGQGWWFALLRSSAGAIKMRRRHLISTV